MAYNNIDQLNLGNLLQIVFSNGVRNQISQDFRDFEMVKRAKVSSSVARELRFMFQKSFGPSAIQYRDPGTSGRSFPDARQATVNEYTAKFKELNATIELEYNLWDRARKSPEKYAEPLALEIDSKSSAAKRRIAADLYGDGTGVTGTVASAAVTSPASDQLTFTLSAANTARGHVGFFEYGDILALRSNTNGTSALDTSLGTEPAYWLVVSKDRDHSQVTLQGLTAAFVSAGTITSITTQPTAGDVFYRYGQPSYVDLTAITDYGTASDVMAGLDSLTAGDGRTVHGITMTGSTSGTRQDAGANPIDVKWVQKCMDKTKINVGQDRYKWKMMSMSPETQASFIESRETDRRFQTIDDNKRGVKIFAYVHGNDTLECYTTEYCPQNRIYILPETKAGEKVLEFHGSDFETVKAQGMGDFHLKPASTGGYVNTVVSYLSAIGVLIAKHPAAIGVVENFTNS